MPAMPNLLTRRFVTFGERNAGSVGPKRMFFLLVCWRNNINETSPAPYGAGFVCFKRLNYFVIVYSIIESIG